MNYLYYNSLRNDSRIYFLHRLKNYKICTILNNLVYTNLGHRTPMAKHMLYTIYQADYIKIYFVGSFIQGATDKLFFLSADTDKGRYTQFSYRPIPITYRYTIFHIGRYRNRYRYRISSNISYRNAIKIFFTIKCNLELLH